MAPAAPVSRRLVTALLVVSLCSAAAPAAAHDDHGDRHWGPERGRKGKPKPKGTSAAPATTAVPATTSVPAPTSVPPAAPAPAPAAPATPAPEAPALGRTVGLAAVSGDVLVRAPGGQPVPLPAGAPAGMLPTGTRVDTRSGAVDLTSARDAAGATQTGRFSGGVFEVRQPAGGRGVTQLVLVGGRWGACKTSAYVKRAAVAQAAKKKGPIRRLWGQDDHGRFQTRGRGSVATVRGTRWLTEDYCSGTRTTVTQGAVAVRSRTTGKVVVVRAGRSVFVAR